MNQYVHYERHIIDNFWDTNDGKDESLIQAFRLISSSDKFVEYCSQNYNDLFVPDDQAEAGVFKRNNLMRWVSRMINSHPLG